MDSPTFRSSLDLTKLAAGNYLVRGDVGAVFQLCHQLGQLRWVQTLAELTELSCNPLGEKTFYVYFYTKEKDVPSDPPPPHTYRFLLAWEKNINFKHPPQGYEYLDLRELGVWNPAQAYLKEHPFPILEIEDRRCEQLLDAVLQFNSYPWLSLSTDECYQWFQLPTSRFFYKLRYSPAAYAHWEMLNHICLLPEEDLKRRVQLYGAWLMLLQRHQRSLVKRGAYYYFQPKRHARLHTCLGWPELGEGIIKIGAFQNLSLYPMEELHENRSADT